MFDFLGLPRETRNNIYFYALVRPHDLVPYPTRWQRQEEARLIQDNQIARDAPIMALLAACKLVYTEGILTFYNFNRFQLPSAHIDMAMEHLGPIFVQYKADIRHIFVSFDFRDLPTFVREYIIRRFLPPLEMLTSAHLQRTHHLILDKRAMMELQKIWMHVACRSIQHHNALPALRTVVLGTFIGSRC